MIRTQDSSPTTQWVALLVLAAALAGLSGCKKQPAPTIGGGGAADPSDSQPLQVVVLGNQQLADAIEREWRSQSQQEFAIENRESSDGKLGEQPINADVVIYPARWLGQLVSDRQIVAWPEAESNDDGGYGWKEIFPALRRQTVSWDKQRYGVTFGEPTYALLYRKDLLDEWGLTPPTTWEAYAKLQAAIEAKGATMKERESGTALVTSLEPLAEGHAARLLLARAASYARHPNQYSALFQIGTMRPLINEPPFVRALSELVESCQHHPADAKKLTPSDVVERFIKGNVALAIGCPSGVGTEAQPPGEVQFAITQLPGTTESYQFSESTWQARESNSTGDKTSFVPLLGASGYMGSVVRGSPAASSARNFLVWLTRDEQATRITRRSTATGPSRNGQGAQASTWVEPALGTVAGQYFEVVEEAQGSTNALRYLRIPEQAAYMTALDVAVRAAISGEATPQSALDEAATAWKEITEATGRREQQTAYRQSLGI